MKTIISLYHWVDVKLLDELHAHLESLVTEQKITILNTLPSVQTRQKIEAADPVYQERVARGECCPKWYELPDLATLRGCDLVLNCVSADALADDTIYTLLEQSIDSGHFDDGKHILIPVIIRVTGLWEDSVFGRFYPLPQGGKVVTQYEDHDVAWANVVLGIRCALKI